MHYTWIVKPEDKHTPRGLCPCAMFANQVAGASPGSVCYGRRHGARTCPLTRANACTASTGCLHGRHGYLRSLPAREYVPVFWAASEVSELQGTELQDKPAQDRYGCGTGWYGTWQQREPFASGACIRMQAWVGACSHG